jgi:hypothetical protein
MRLKFVQYDADGSGALDAQEFARYDLFACAFHTFHWFRSSSPLSGTVS